jgi:hypothetical protein
MSIINGVNEYNDPDIEYHNWADVKKEIWKAISKMKCEQCMELKVLLNWSITTLLK